MVAHPECFTFIAAELLFVIVRSADITIAAKAKKQLTKDEETSIQRGLRRSILLEALIFVPASATLVVLLAPLFITDFIKDTPSVSATYAAMGVTSYGFPFIAIKKMVTTVALNTLREFAELTTKGSGSSGGEA